MIRVSRTNLDFEREPMAAGFGCKGGFVKEAWQVVALMEREAGKRGVGLGVQGVLWSDAAVCAAWPESAGNSLMLLLSAYGLRVAQETPFDTPDDLLDRLL